MLGDNSGIMLKNITKILIFLALIGGFHYIASLKEGTLVSWGIYHAWNKGAAWFVVGAACAIWGDKKIESIDPDPISLRGVFIVLGILMMLFGLILSGALRDAVQQPNHPMSRTGGSATGPLMMANVIAALPPVGYLERWAE